MSSSVSTGRRAGAGARLRRLVADTRPLTVPAFRRVFVGQSTAVVGMMVTSVTVSVQLYALTRSSLVVGFAGLAGLVPILVLGLYGGAVADVMDRRRLYLLSCAVTSAATLALVTQSLVVPRAPTLILVLVAVRSGGDAVSASARGAFIPQLVPTA